MKGEHILDSKGSVQVVINNVDNLILRGERSHFNTEIIIIRCSNNIRGLVFNNGSIITIYGISITGCGQQDISPLLLINIAKINVHYLRIYINELLSIGHDQHSPDIKIYNSNSASCNHGGGGLYICFNSGIYSRITIANSEFANNTIHGDGGGLYIYSGTGTYNSITITNIAFTRNTIYGNGLCIFSDTDTYNNITITNTSFSSNTVHEGGTGLYIHTGANTGNSVTIANSILTDNTINEGELYIIYSGINSYNNANISNFKITKNKVSGVGGRLYIYYDNGTHNNIIINNSAFCNNIMHYNYNPFGELHMIYLGRGAYNNVTITYGTYSGNVIDGNGTGMYINLDDGTQNNITITNSEFIHNIIYGVGGGLYIYSKTGTCTNINITTSKFIHNIIYLIHGIGVGLYVDSGIDTRNNLTISNSAFNDNRVSIGGALYVYSDTNTSNFIHINGTTFTNNSAHIGGGVVMMFSTGTHNNIMITNSTITNNIFKGIYGGGIVIWCKTNNRTQIHVANSDISYTSAGTNSPVGGCGLFILSYSNTYGTITNSVFSNNDGNGLTLFTDGFQKIEFAHVKISDNSGSAVDTNGHCTVIFTKGQSIIANNSSPTDGGGIYLDIGSYLTTSNGGHVRFINNTAKRYGGAIYSFDNDRKIITKTIQYQVGDANCSVYNLSATFTNNSALKAGDIPYTGKFLRCKIFANFTNLCLVAKINCHKNNFR